MLSKAEKWIFGYLLVSVIILIIGLIGCLLEMFIGAVLVASIFAPIMFVGIGMLLVGGVVGLIAILIAVILD